MLKKAISPGILGGTPEMLRKLRALVRSSLTRLAVSTHQPGQPGPRSEVRFFAPLKRYVRGMSESGATGSRWKRGP